MRAVPVGPRRARVWGLIKGSSPARGSGAVRSRRRAGRALLTGRARTDCAQMRQAFWRGIPDQSSAAPSWASPLHCPTARHGRATRRAFAIRVTPASGRKGARSRSPNARPGRGRCGRVLHGDEPVSSEQARVSLRCSGCGEAGLPLPHHEPHRPAATAWIAGGDRHPTRSSSTATDYHRTPGHAWEQGPPPRAPGPGRAVMHFAATAGAMSLKTPNTCSNELPSCFE